MRFLDPLMLVGAALAALPIIIHLINRRRAVRRRFPAIEFLLRSNKSIAKRLKLKQLLLLLLRIALFLLLPLAMARPYLLSDEGSTADERLPTAVVYVLDDSFSMGHDSGGETAFERAKAALLERLDALRPWDQVALVLARQPAEAPVGELTEERGPVRDALEERVAPSFLTTDLVGALELAADIQATGELPGRRTVVLTDNAASAWTRRELAAETLVQLGQIEVVDVSEGEARQNVAIVSAEFAESVAGGEGDYDITARLHNYGDEPREDVRVDLLLDRELVGSSLVAIEANGDVAAGFTVGLADDDLHRAELALRLDGPDIEADNHRYLTLHLDREVRALLVNGDPRTIAYRDELFYLERALETGPEDASGIATDVVGVEGLDATFSDYDVVVLANVDALPQARVAELNRFVRSGGGLLFTSGPRVDPERANRVFGELLPKPLRSVRELCNPRDPDANLLATRIARVEATHPVFRVFDLPGGESIQSVSVYSYLLLEPTPLGTARTVMSYGDGGPALVERDLGSGRVALLTTSIDRDWTDLPIRTAFLPLVRRTVRYLARRGATEEESEALVGERVSLDIEAQRPDRVTIVDPAGGRYALTPEPPDPDRVDFRPRLPGHYDVSLDISGLSRRFDELLFAANLDVAESDLSAVDPELIAAYENASAAPSEGAAIDVPERRLSLWPVALFALLVLLYVESGLAARRRMWERLGGRVRGGWQRWRRRDATG